MVGPDYVYIYSDSISDSLVNYYGENVTFPLYDGVCILENNSLIC